MNPEHILILVPYLLQITLPRKYYLGNYKEVSGKNTNNLGLYVHTLLEF
jgi:hypothetical protein